MEQESNNLSVPYSYARCFNDHCAQGENCLRHKAALYDAVNDPFITILNPSHFSKNGESCAYFKNAEKVRVAWGVKRLFDRIPFEDAVSIKKQLIRYFGKNQYYRFYREERCILPKDQAYICWAFRNNGVTEAPSFGRYTEEYIW